MFPVGNRDWSYGGLRHRENQFFWQLRTAGKFQVATIAGFVWSEEVKPIIQRLLGPRPGAGRGKSGSKSIRVQMAGRMGKTEAWTTAERTWPQTPDSIKASLSKGFSAGLFDSFWPVWRGFSFWGGTVAEQQVFLFGGPSKGFAVRATGWSWFFRSVTEYLGHLFRVAKRGPSQALLSPKKATQWDADELGKRWKWSSRARRLWSF